MFNSLFRYALFCTCSNFFINFQKKKISQYMKWSSLIGISIDRDKDALSLKNRKDISIYSNFWQTTGHIYKPFWKRKYIVSIKYKELSILSSYAFKLSHSYHVTLVFFITCIDIIECAKCVQNLLKDFCKRSSTI